MLILASATISKGICMNIRLNYKRDVSNPDRLICDMVAGEKGYVVPWSVDGDSLNVKYRVYKERGGSVTVYIVCVRPCRFNGKGELVDNGLYDVFDL